MALNLKEEILMLEIGKEFLAVKVVRPWHRLPEKLLVPRNAEGQVGWSSGQPGLLGGVPVHGRGLD